MKSVTTLDFRIDAWSPETLPMARLAEYALHLAKLFGSEGSVHLLKVRKGSAVPEILVDQEAVPKVQQRLALVGSPDVPKDIENHWNKTNQLLRDDNASAVLGYKHGAKILEFPGRKVSLAEEVTVHEQGAVEGVVVRVGGMDESIPVWLQGEDGKKLQCNATRDIAKQISKFLFEKPIRVIGNGKWKRTRDRLWELENFDIKSFESLDETPLCESIARLQALDTEWAKFDDPQAELRRLRSS